MIDSPAATLYHTLKKVFTPLLLEQSRGERLGSKIPTLLTELEGGLGTILKRQAPGKSHSVDSEDAKNAGLAGILSVDDELEYWKVVKKKPDVAAGLSCVVAELTKIHDGRLEDLDDMLENLFTFLDELWKLDEAEYPQDRMSHLMELCGIAICQRIQQEFNNVNVWSSPFSQLEGIISAGKSLCDKWIINVCGKLTTLFWATYGLHHWKGPAYEPKYTKGFGDRLEEFDDAQKNTWTARNIYFKLELSVITKQCLFQILNVRTVHRQLTNLLSHAEQAQLHTKDAFEIFLTSGLNPVQYNPYTNNVWLSALQQYENFLKPAERRIAEKLKGQLRSLEDNVLQLNQEFRRYLALLQHNVIREELAPEREVLLSKLTSYLQETQAKFSKSGPGPIPQYDDTSSDLVKSIIWIHQLESRLNSMEQVGKKVLVDLKDYSKFQAAMSDFKDQLKMSREDLFSSWARDIQDSASALSLATDKSVVKFTEGKNKIMVVNYNPKLVMITREVRQLGLLGYKIPKPIMDLSAVALGYIKLAKSLDHIANFHNTVGQRILPPLLPLLLQDALQLDNLVKTDVMTWKDTKAVENYIQKLSIVVTRLGKNSTTLTHRHLQIKEKVKNLMSTDLLRKEESWKSELVEIRKVIQDTEQVFPDTKSWKIFWNYQLYKALEHQYQLGLEALNQHLPEINISLELRNQRLQFSPSLEDIRRIYYSGLKKFLAIPNRFKGVADDEHRIFGTMIERNASRFNTLFVNAENLFDKLQSKTKTYLVYVTWAFADFSSLAENLETSEDWDTSFRAVNNIGQFINKIPQNEKLDCFAITYYPVIEELEKAKDRYLRALDDSLQRAVAKNCAGLELFVEAAGSTLSQQPQSVEELGEISLKHAELASRMPEMKTLIGATKEMNDTLARFMNKRVESVQSVMSTWDNFLGMMDSHESVFAKQMDAMRSNLLNQETNFTQEVEKFASRWHEFKPKEDILEAGNPGAIDAGIRFVKDKRKDWDELMETHEKLKSDFQKFQMELPEIEKVAEISKDLEKYELMWCQLEEFKTGMKEMQDEQWSVFRSQSYKFEEYLTSWEEKLAQRTGDSSKLSIRLSQDIEKFKAVVPVLKFVRGDYFSDKHWLEIFSLVGIPTSVSPSQLTFGHLLNARDALLVNSDKLKEINGRAQAEVSIRQALDKLDVWAFDCKFTFREHKDSVGRDISLIKEWKDIVSKVGDHQMVLQSVKDSPYYDAFSGRANEWETKLADLDNYLMSLNQIQRKWEYLEPIFGNKLIPDEKALSRFNRIDGDFKVVLSDIRKDPKVVSLCRISGIKRTLENLSEQLSWAQKSLNDFLEEWLSLLSKEMKGTLQSLVANCVRDAKGSSSPDPLLYPQQVLCLAEAIRFTEKCEQAIGGNSLPRFRTELEVQSRDEGVIQQHLKKLFAGIHSVQLDPTSTKVIAMNSLEGESVPLNNPVPEWLSLLSKEMKGTLQSLVANCVRDAKGSSSPDPLLYPQQVLCLAEAIRFTEKCEIAIGGNSLSRFRTELENLLESLTTQDLDSTDPETQVLELKLKALILDTVHNIDVVTQLITANVKDVADWGWQKQLRYYLDSNKVVMRMVDAQFDYTYEYQGNAGKLVHTPLTDKCYMTLTQGMKMGLGGNPYGPAGTGKTESVKALGGLFGRQVLVFNCDEGIDVKSMGRIFVGIVKCGAWGCFDEFNRLDEAVLSAVSMQIQSIQAALLSGNSTTSLLEKTVDLDPNSGIFITLNPAGKGYGGRQKLPDNLKQLFRPIAMSKPDNELIAEVILFSEGFKTAKTLGGKLVELFVICRELLSPQQHYDWGLRALKTVLRGCGSLLATTRQALKPGVIDGEKETEIAVQALRLNTLSKLTFGDAIRFDALVKDMFPGVPLKDPAYDMLKKRLESSADVLGIVVSPAQLKKAIELYEQLQQRTGVVVVGPSGCGKSTLWRLLHHALTHPLLPKKPAPRANTEGSPADGDDKPTEDDEEQKDEEEKISAHAQQDVLKIVLHTMNPKSIPRTQLLGFMDPDTREWTDGVLTKSARAVVALPKEVKSWIVCDGDIDPEWIESLNSVLDDNRLLTMPSGERIQFGPNVNFLFETHDLSSASPATISRMGMIFMSDENTDVKAVVQAWIKRQEAASNQLEQNVEDFFYKALQWVLKEGDRPVETSLLGVVLNGLSHLEKAESKAKFVAGLIHGLGANLTLASRRNFASQVFSWTGEYPPNAKDPANLYYDPRKDCLESYEGQVVNKVNVGNLSEGNLPAISTVGFLLNMDLFQPWIQAESGKPFLLVGPEGCGKSLILHDCFDDLKSTQVVTVFCSSQTTPQQIIQKLSQACKMMTTNTGQVLKPVGAERLILYMKDINLPKPDKYGTAMLIAFLQQLITYNGYYDTNLDWVGLDGVHIVGSMAPGSALGRHHVSTRLTSIMRIAYLDYPEANEMADIYQNYLGGILAQVTDDNSPWRSAGRIESIAYAMIKLYEQLQANFSVDDHGHYVFTPRDLTRWAMGLLRYDVRSLAENGFLMAWCHEALRLFRDKMSGEKDRDKFDRIFYDVLAGIQGTGEVFADLNANFFVTPGASSEKQTAAGAPLPPLGKMLGKLGPIEWQSVVEKAIVRYSRENEELDLEMFREPLDLMSRMDRILTKPKGSVLIAGRAGVGRKPAAGVIACMHNFSLYFPRLTAGYNFKTFSNDLKQAMTIAAIEGMQVAFFVEDAHMAAAPECLEVLNGLLAAGEAPGLFAPDELEPVLAKIKPEASSEGFRGGALAYFSMSESSSSTFDFQFSFSSLKVKPFPMHKLICKERWSVYEHSHENMRIWSLLVLFSDTEEVQRNLHFIFIMDFTDPMFKSRCESNPALYKQCSVIWSEGWSNKSLRLVPSMYLPREKKTATETRTLHLKAGVQKLQEAQAVVAKLQTEADKDQKVCAAKQAEANEALTQIKQTMFAATNQREAMQTLKDSTAKEEKQIKERHKAIDIELAEVEPLIQEARAAVGNIKAQAITEIRSYSAPPTVIRDILEGVLRLMGILDTSWNSMKSFLAKKGIKEEIRNFDARKTSPSDRRSVEKLLEERGDSFEPATAKRASAAAEPLAAWVKATVKFARVVEKIKPLEDEQSKLQGSLKNAQDQMLALTSGLTDVDEKVAVLQEKFNQSTKEATQMEIKLQEATQKIKSAQDLIGKLSGEYKRWSEQVNELTSELDSLAPSALLAAAFITYLCSSTEDVRRETMKLWRQVVAGRSLTASFSGRLSASFTGKSITKPGKNDSNSYDFDLRSFLSSEREQLVWKSEGLPSDDLSMENALIILLSKMRPMLVDPSGRASEWLKVHLEKLGKVEEVNPSERRFATTLELAVEFGKILIVSNVESIPPVLYPILRNEKKVFVGDKLVDYNTNFKLFLTTRNPSPAIPPVGISAVTITNFSTTKAGLTGQLLAAALQEEKPELETRRKELLRQSEDMKVSLLQMEDTVLEKLAKSKGDILSDHELLSSLTEMKASAEKISKNLTESVGLQASLEAERNTYLPLAETGANLYFVIQDLLKMNNMYRFSLGCFTELFQKALQTGDKSTGNTEQRVEGLKHSLLVLVYHYVSQSLYKKDRTMFALHLAHGMKPEMFHNQEWEAFTGMLVTDVKLDVAEAKATLPSWINEERALAVSLLKGTFPDFFALLRLDDAAMWNEFSKHPQCEIKIPSDLSKRLTAFQNLLVVQALRPDRLHSAMKLFATRGLGLKELAPPGLNLGRTAKETKPNEPILLLINAGDGADPSQEISELAKHTFGNDAVKNRFIQVAMGQGQAEIALNSLTKCSVEGGWLMLQNLHLTVAWLSDLEQALGALQTAGTQVHPDFKLWLTTESHPLFASNLLQISRKITYEAPAGVKRNLIRTYEGWNREMNGRLGSSVLRARSLAALAWFNAVVQERRSYIPQGWTKYYEFSSADQRCGVDILDRVLTEAQRGRRGVKWEFIHELYLNAVYGGRVESSYDLQVMASYLQDYFSDSTLTEHGTPKQSLAGTFDLPDSNEIQDYVTIFKNLPDFDKPSYFGLPANMEGVVERNTSSEVISQLRVLMRVADSVDSFDREKWSAELSPVLNLWKKLNQGSDMHKAKLSPPDLANSDQPVTSFLQLEYYNAVLVVQSVHKSLAELSKVINGSLLLSSKAKRIAADLMQQETPGSWLSLWDGPEEPMSYLRALASKAQSVQRLAAKNSLVNANLDLSQLLHPNMFLTALRQETAREYAGKVPLDGLRLVN
ncbi:unnamed protein product, partial [Notodromas monacha]